jgi:hypothetical protein
MGNMIPQRKIILVNRIYSPYGDIDVERMKNRRNHKFFVFQLLNVSSSLQVNDQASRASAFQFNIE